MTLFFNIENLPDIPQQTFSYEVPSFLKELPDCETCGRCDLCVGENTMPGTDRCIQARGVETQILQ